MMHLRIGKNREHMGENRLDVDKENRLKDYSEMRGNTSKLVFNMKTNLMVKLFSLVPRTGKLIIGQTY